MVKAISSAWKENTSSNIHNEVRAYINPRGREYGPISSAGSFVSVSASDNVPGTFNGYQLNNVYAIPFSEPKTIDFLVKPNFAYATAEYIIASWTYGTQYVKLGYNHTVKRWFIARYTTAETRVYFGPTFASDITLQVWQYLTVQFGGSYVSLWHNQENTIAPFVTTTLTELPLFNIGGGVNCYFNYARIFDTITKRDGVNLLEYPDDPAGVTYLQDAWATVDGWSAVRCTIDTSTKPGTLIITATDVNPAITKAVSALGKTVRVKLRKIFSNATVSRITDVALLAYEKTYTGAGHIHDVTFAASGGTNVGIYPGGSSSITVAGDVFEIDFIYIGTGASSQSFKDTSNAEIYFDFNKTHTGRERCSITSNGDLFSYSIDNPSTYAAASVSLSVFNYDGQYNDDTFKPLSGLLPSDTLYPSTTLYPEDNDSTFTPEDGEYNGTSDQNYLQRRVGCEIESWYPSSNPMAYWSMDNEAEMLTGVLKDDSGNGFNGTIYGATPVASISGKALAFDGVNDYASLPVATPAIHSISIWAYIPVANPPTRNSIISSSYFPGIDILNGDIIYRFNDGTVTRDVGTSKTPYNGQAVHIVATNDGLVGRLYINGLLKNSSSYPSIAGSLNLLLGKRPDGQFYTGTIDEPRIYNRALSAEEVRYLYLLNPDNVLTRHQFEPLFIGSIPPGSFSRSVQAGGGSTISLSADDGIADIARKIVRKNRNYEDFYLTKESTPATSLFHTIAKLATEREIYNYLCNSGFENTTIANSWTVTGGTIARSTTQKLFGTYSCKLNASSIAQSVNFELSKGERFNYSVYAYSATPMYVSTKIIEYINSTIVGSSVTPMYHSGNGWELIDVTHTIINSSSNKLSCVVEPSTTGDIYLDGSMLVYGDYKPFYIDNTNDGTAGASTSSQAMRGAYDWIGIDGDTVSYQHPWASVKEGKKIWNYLKAIGDATIARYIYVDRSGVLKYKSSLVTALGYSLGAIDKMAAIGSTVQSEIANKVKVAGVFINKQNNISNVWQVEASGLDDDNDDGATFSRAIANGATFPLASEAPDGYEAKYGDVYKD